MTTKPLAPIDHLRFPCTGAFLAALSATPKAGIQFSAMAAEDAVWRCLVASGRSDLAELIFA